jgi:hypothetical protein
MAKKSASNIFWYLGTRSLEYGSALLEGHESQSEILKKL